MVQTEVTSMTAQKRKLKLRVVSSRWQQVEKEEGLDCPGLVVISAMCPAPLPPYPGLYDSVLVFFFFLAIIFKTIPKTKSKELEVNNKKKTKIPQTSIYQR